MIYSNIVPKDFGGGNCILLTNICGVPVYAKINTKKETNTSIDNTTGTNNLYQYIVFIYLLLAISTII